LNGLIDRAPKGGKRDRSVDGQYAMYIIGMTTIALGVVMAAAVMVTAPLREGWLSIAVGAVFIIGGGGAALRAKWHMKQPNGEG
jgi:uncharacterized membrane protein HdeD (DUF308 family)